MSCPHLFDVAPYALGTLDPSERADVAAHLPDCRDCQAVLESVAGLPGLLARVSPDAVEPAREVPDEAMFERLAARGAAMTTARRPRRWRTWVTAAAAAVVLGIGGALVVATQSHDPTRVVAASSGAVHATVWVRPAPSGTAVRLELGGVPSEEHCRLVAVDRAGHRTVAATWEATYSGTATFTGSVPVPVADLVALQVETDTATLLRFPLS